MKGPQVKRLELDIGELRATLQQARSRPIDEQEYGQLGAVLDTMLFVTQELDKKGASIRRLRKLLFGARTEKTRDVLGEQTKDNEPAAAEAGTESGAEADGQDATDSTKKKKKRKGHGRNGAAAYWGAEKVKISHPSLTPGCACPNCIKGKVYRMAVPAVLVLVKAEAPVQAKVYEAEKYRCNLCGEVFQAQFPPDLPTSKYDETVGAMIGLLKCGMGLPFYRLAKLQSALGIPLPASTQWDLVYRSAKTLAPGFVELIRQGAQGQVLHNDDTSAKILALMGKPREAAAETEASSQEDAARTGVFTSGIVSTTEGRSIALFFTGRKHAGENLEDVLAHRASELAAPIQMCDALSRNVPAEFKTILANCLSHARRRFVDVAVNFPAECRHVLETLRDVYANDAVARKQRMSPAERLRFHQSKSGPLIEALKEWLDERFEQKLVEPNSGLGEAISYMRKHWEKLTLFLRVAGAPMDNNICERALKKAILSRKNSYFYQTENGAFVGDLFMSFIHTCELNGTNPFDYLVALLRHPEQLRQAPGDWMPWNYKQALEHLAVAA